MKANTKFGTVQIESKDGNTLNIILEDGTKKKIMPMFVPVTDELGNKITDFSSVPDYTSIPTVSKSKESKLADMMANAAENRGEQWDSKKGRFVKI